MKRSSSAGSVKESEPGTRSVRSRALWLVVVAASMCLPLPPASAAGEFRAYVTTAEGVTVIDTASNTVVASIPLARPVSIAITQDGALLLVEQPDENRIAVIDARTHVLVRTIPVPGRPNNLALTPDGALGVVTTQRICEPDGECVGANTVSVIDARTHMLLGTIPLPGRPYSLALTSDGALGVVTTQRICEPQGQCVGAHSVAVIDVVERAVVASFAPDFEFDSGPAEVAITPDGASAYVGEGGGLRVIDLGSRTSRMVPVICCAFGIVAIAPDGRSVYVPTEEFGYYRIEIIKPVENARGVISTGSTPAGLFVFDQLSGRGYYQRFSDTASVLVVFEYETLSWIASIPLPHYGGPTAISPEPARVYVLLPMMGAVAVIDAATLTLTDTVRVGERPMGIVIGRVPPAATPTPTATPAVATATPTQSRRSSDGCAVAPGVSSTGALVCVMPPVLLLLRRRRRAARVVARTHPDRRADAEGSDSWRAGRMMMTHGRFVVWWLLVAATVVGTGRVEASERSLVILKAAGAPGENMAVQLDLARLTALRDRAVGVSLPPATILFE